MVAGQVAPNVLPRVPDVRFATRLSLQNFVNINNLVPSKRKLNIYLKNNNMSNSPHLMNGEVISTGTAGPGPVECTSGNETVIEAAPIFTFRCAAGARMLVRSVSEGTAVSMPGFHTATGITPASTVECAITNSNSNKHSHIRPAGSVDTIPLSCSLKPEETTTSQWSLKTNTASPPSDMNVPLLQAVHLMVYNSQTNPRSPVVAPVPSGDMNNLSGVCRSTVVDALMMESTPTMTVSDDDFALTLDAQVLGEYPQITECDNSVAIVEDVVLSSNVSAVEVITARQREQNMRSAHLLRRLRRLQCREVNSSVKHKLTTLIASVSPVIAEATAVVNEATSAEKNIVGSPLGRNSNASPGGKIPNAYL